MNVHEWIQINAVTLNARKAYMELSEIVDVWEAEYKEVMPDLSGLETVWDLLSDSVTMLERVLCGVTPEGIESETSNNIEIKKIKQRIKGTREYIEEYEEKIAGLKADVVLYETDLVGLGVKV